MGKLANGKGFSANPNDYKLLEEVGYGASATVYRAIYLPLNELVAVKCLDLDRCNSNLDDIRREAQTMSLIDHPNVIRAYCSFVVNQNLWVVMPFMAEGSCLHLMKIAYPDGFEESSICCILKETLKALEYLHQQGHIHRDVKAGNILLDSNGDINLGDFGVSACIFDKCDRQRSRNTFVGTPCWMAPEVLQPGTGYDFKADIWSFGITALELAHGHAPFSKYPPMKVLLMTIQNAPPGLDYDRDKKFSKSFKEMVAMCLVKDQTKRPTAGKLLKHSFFKNAKPPQIAVKKLFSNLPPLWNRVKVLELKDAAQLALKKMPSSEQEALSQSEYQRGVSAWNFDIEDLKIQASLLEDYDEIKEEEEYMKFGANSKDSSVGKSTSTSDIISSEQINGGELSQSVSFNDKGNVPKSDLLDSSFQGKTSPEQVVVSGTQLQPSTSEKDNVQQKARTIPGKQRQTQSGPLMPGVVLTHSASEKIRPFERYENDNQSLIEKNQNDIRRTPSLSGPLMLPNRASSNSLSAPIKSSGGFRDSLEDKSKTNLVQIKGRFSVTSENVDLVKDIPLSAVPRRSQGSPLRKSASVGERIFDAKQMPIGQSSAKEVFNTNISASLLMPQLQNLFQQTSFQQDLIVNILNNLQGAAGEVEASPNGKLLPPLPRISDSNGNVTTIAQGVAESSSSVASEREQMLLAKISDLQTRMIELTAELTAEKQKYMQLQEETDKVRREADA
ncbi:serine/threonine-protein kinase BLUS1-like [Impatiens glandulifera]|uniref:serine/threonine-protein kinase BLUS1-like n=1 Tax=Impatiens glandulifera TaxID=253017 RepID=UPI001FB15C9A|nr:serine/threonine-protein kinase BLUS1-like [Impatiens glandulifera]